MSLTKRDVSLIVLYDSDKRILLQHRDGDWLPGYWGFFGGGIDDGETPEQAVKRESFEELNYTPINPKLLFTHDYNHFGRYGTKHVFAEHCLDKSSLVLKEGQGWGWYNIKDTESIKMSETDRLVIKKLDELLFS